MTQGPFGAPRFLELLPLPSDQIEVQTEEDRVSNGLLTPEAEDLLQGLQREEGLLLDNWVKVDRTVIIKRDTEDGPIGIINKIQDEISDLGERAASISYFIFENQVGYISGIRVDGRFRRNGIGGVLREQALDDMRQLGADIAYSFPVSVEGKALAKSQDFEPSDRLEGFFVKEL